MEVCYLIPIVNAAQKIREAQGTLFGANLYMLWQQKEEKEQRGKLAVEYT